MNVIVAAHPDDEVIGLGAQLPYLREVFFIHITDGAPRDMVDANAHGFAKREDYARQRRRELLNALSLSRIPESRCQDLPFADQEASLHLTEVTNRLCELLRDLRPQYVVTHPYEGGHPDHDAAAFASHIARQLLIREGHCPGILIEFTSYHALNGCRVTGDFLPSHLHHTLTVSLSAEQQHFKKTLFSCFQTQQSVLADFPLDAERFRSAPGYDFRKPPHEGRLYYENFPWGMTGSHWS